MLALLMVIQDDYILDHDSVVMWTGAEILDWYRSQTLA